MTMQQGDLLGLRNQARYDGDNRSGGNWQSPPAGVIDAEVAAELGSSLSSADAATELLAAPVAGDRVRVGPRAVVKLPYVVQGNDVLRWEFCVRAHDVRFSVSERRMASGGAVEVGSVRAVAAAAIAGGCAVTDVSFQIFPFAAQSPGWAPSRAFPHRYSRCSSRVRASFAGRSTKASSLSRASLVSG